MIRFSANLGFLWTDRHLADAIRAAKSAGFAAVEVHAPYDTPSEQVSDALAETQLPMLGLNTRRGSRPEDRGLAAVPGREGEAREIIEEAVSYASIIGAQSVHVLAGTASGLAARETFVANLAFAARMAAEQGITILIEPLNRHDAPGYFLRTTDQARDLIEDVAAENLKLMFDCYHVGRTEGDIVTRLKDLLPVIGHIQFASVPDRGPPDHGELDYRTVFAAIEALGWERPLGAEYKCDGGTDGSLGWMASLG